jgi:protein phosphatase
MEIHLPEFCLVLLIGSLQSGKSTFAHTHFNPGDVLSLDTYLAEIPENTDLYSGTTGAVRRLNDALARRLKGGQFTVIDTDDLREDTRRTFLATAHRYYTQVIGIVFDLPSSVIRQRLQVWSENPLTSQLQGEQFTDLAHVLRNVRHEGFDNIVVFRTVDDVNQAQLVRDRLPVNYRHLHGPFDIIGDVHGCYDELVELLTRLGYRIDMDSTVSLGLRVTPPDGRTLIFVGDLVDRGPKVVETLKLAMQVVSSGAALCVPGNHDDKLMRALKGRPVKVAHGLEQSLEQLEVTPRTFKEAVREFISDLPSHLVLDDGQLIVAHAGLKLSMHGRNTKSVRDFAMYGLTTGKLDQYGLPERINWAKEYQGAARVIYGHTPIPRHTWQNNTLNIDTGCVFGGALSALRLPENEIVTVRAKRQYALSARPFLLELDADRDSVVGE